jgi:3-methylornithyl-N6-L-lysine dehydrogenase
MTLLKSKDIEDIVPSLKEYDMRLQAATGSSLLDIACRAAGIDSATAMPLIAATKVISVQTTCGEGKISGFVETLATIAHHLGFPAEAARQSDAAGLAEAYQKQADIILTADDNQFIAINTRTRRVVDNGDATGRGFAFGLDCLVGGLENKDVLVIGCGPVGRSVCRALMDLKAVVSVFDINGQICSDFVKHVAGDRKTDIRIEPDIQTALGSHPYVIDTTPAPNLINETFITPHTCISAPGVPCGVNNKARQMLGDRLIHDPLQIGVATMLLSSLQIKIN